MSSDSAAGFGSTQELTMRTRGDGGFGSGMHSHSITNSQGLLMMIACGDGDGGVSHPFCCLDQICTKEHNNIFYVDSVLMAGARSFSAAREWIQAGGPGVWTLVI